MPGSKRTGKEGLGIIQDSQPFVSIIVPTYKRRDLLKRLLNSLLQMSYPKNKYEVAVIGDSTYDDNTAEMVENLTTIAPFKLRYLECHHPSPSAKRNLGIKGARGAIIGFTDDDCVVDPDWISRAVPHFSDTSVAGVQGRTSIPPPGYLSPSYYYATGITEPGYQTCNVFYRKRVLEEVGGFDERFTSISREDSDIAFTFLEKGYNITTASEVIVEHPVREGESWDLIKSAKRGLSDPLLFKKHPRLYRDNIGSVFSNLYRLFYLLLTGIITFVLLGNYILAASFFLFYLTLLFWKASRYLKDAAFSGRDWSTCLISLLVSPYILLYSVLKGNLKYRSLLWY